MTAMPKLFGAALLLLASNTFAGELLESYVDKKEDHFIIHLDMRIDAEFEDVYEVLIDFNNLPAVNDTIESSELIKTEDRSHVVRFVSNGCVWVICQRVTQLVKVKEYGRGYIMTEVIPDKSDMKYGRTLWHVINEGETTRIKYDSDLVPNFWLPPLVGASIFQSRLLEEGIKTINGIENLINDY